MSSIKYAAIAAIAAVLATLAAQGTASARGFSPSANDLRSNSAASRSHSVNDPAIASIGRPSGNVMFGSKLIGRDPDPNVRLDLLRDRDIGRF